MVSSLKICIVKLLFILIFWDEFLFRRGLLVDRAPSIKAKVWGRKSARWWWRYFCICSHWEISGKKKLWWFQKNHFTVNIASYQGKQSIHCQRLFPRHTMECVAFWNWSEQTQESALCVWQWCLEVHPCGWWMPHYSFKLVSGIFRDKVSWIVNLFYSKLVS